MQNIRQPILRDRGESGYCYSSHNIWLASHHDIASTSNMKRCSGEGGTVGHHIAPISSRGITTSLINRALVSPAVNTVLPANPLKTHYQWNSGKILSHFYAKNIFLGKLWKYINTNLRICLKGTTISFLLSVRAACKISE